MAHTAHYEKMGSPLIGAARYASSSLIGFCAGTTLGLVGWGGAQVIIPSLTSPWMGLSQLAATGTSLTSLSVAATVGAGQFLYHDSAHLTTALCISLPSIVAARFGSRLAGKISSEVHALIFNGLSVVLIPTHFVVQQWRQNQKADPKALSDMNTSVDDARKAERAARQPASLSVSTPFTLPPPEVMAKHAGFGAVCGMLSALMGVGGLPLTISYLTLSLPEMPHHIVQGTAMCSVLPSVLTSAYIQGKAGHTPLSLAAAVCCGSVLGSSFGARVALALEEEQLRNFFIASLVILGGRSFLAANMNIFRIVQARRAAAAVIKNSK